MMELLVEEFDTPCGLISIVFEENDVLYHLDFPDQGDRQQRLLKRRFGDVSVRKAKSRTIRRHVENYMNGDLSALDLISCDIGGSAFQRKVWEGLKQIKAGATVSYRQLADFIEQPTAVRAVAHANALNPISLIYPCHRVIGTDGALRGYAGGLDRKAWLLRHEGVLI